MSRSLSSRIKEATKESHQALEGVVIPKLKAISSEADYALILQKFYGFHQPVESLLDQYLDESEIPDYSKRRRSHLILRDLDSMNRPHPHFNAAKIPEINSLASAFGVYYVFEGSTQGGVIIAQMLTKAGIPTEAINFFNAYKELAGPMWNSFKERLDEFSDDENFSNEAVASAKETFELFRNWMLV